MDVKMEEPPIFHLRIRGVECRSRSSEWSSDGNIEGEDRDPRESGQGWWGVRNGGFWKLPTKTFEDKSTILYWLRRSKIGGPSNDAPIFEELLSRCDGSAWRILVQLSCHYESVFIIFTYFVTSANSVFVQILSAQISCTSWISR